MIKECKVVYLLVKKRQKDRPPSRIALLGYVAIAGASTAYEWISSARKNEQSRAIEMGSERFGRDDVRHLQIYSDEEIAAKPYLRDVELVYFPNKSGERKDFIIYLPGGAYLNCNLDIVAIPGAAVANQYDYPAFALKYRVRRHTDDYAPIEDLARALKYIKQNADELNVRTENYMITGFSAGGNLAGLFCSKNPGCGKYGLNKPCCLTLAYPWSNINAGIKPSWNIFKMAYNLLGRELSMRVLLGAKADFASREGVCVQNAVDENFPPCYIIQGDRDFLAPKEIHADQLVAALVDKGVKYKYIVCSNLSHGFGVGIGTSAEGWIKDSLEFWEEYKSVRR